jgi:hypothetical protein
MDVAKSIWLTGSPTKGHFSSKHTKNAFLVLKKDILPENGWPNTLEIV